MSTFFLKKQGSILVSAILVLLMMTILGVGLTHSVSLRLKNAASQGAVNAAVSAAESCVYEQVKWLTSLRVRPIGNNNNPLQVSRANLLALGGLSDGIMSSVRALDAGYSYQCSVNAINGRCTSNDASGVGGNIGSTSSNGRRFCYLVNSRGDVGGRRVDLLVTLSKGF